MVVLCSVIFYSCATTVSVNSKRLSQNHKFDGGVTIYELKVDSFYSYGAPAKYSNKIYCKAINRRFATERTTVPEYRPADTLHVVNGPRIYIAAGVRRPSEYILVQREMGRIKESIKTKEQKVIYFNKPNKQYYWLHAGKEVFEKIQRVVFKPGQWYGAYIDCTYGLLADGTCKLYFRFNEKGKVEFHRVDDVNDGPF
jgi:hypothetical protein